MDIGIEFGIKKCGVLVLKGGKIVKMEGMEGYKYLGILETDQLKEKETKDLFSKE